VGLALSSSSEPSLAQSTDSSLSTWATHCLRDVLRMGFVSCKHCKTATPSFQFSIIMEYVMLRRCTLLYHVSRRPHATDISGIECSTTACGGSCCLPAGRPQFTIYGVRQHTTQRDVKGFHLVGCDGAKVICSQSRVLCRLVLSPFLCTQHSQGNPRPQTS